jgi:hypothetical protein
VTGVIHEELVMVDKKRIKLTQQFTVAIERQVPVVTVKLAVVSWTTEETPLSKCAIPTSSNDGINSKPSDEQE